MNQDKIAFEWQELDEDEALPPIAARAQTPKFPNRRFRQDYLLIGGALCLLFVALVAARWPGQQAEAEQAQIQRALATAVDDQLERAAPSGKHIRDLEHVDYKVVDVEVAALRQDVVAATVIGEKRFVYSDQPVRYRQLHFYRQTDQGWQPTEPVPDLWGQQQRLATEHFDITYRSRDAQAVQAVAAELDALYARMRYNLGLPPRTSPSIVSGKIAINVVIEPVSEHHIASDERAVKMIVSSPVLLSAPDSLDHAAILRQSILLDLVGKIVEEGAHTHQIPAHAYPLLSAMGLWQIWDLGGPLAAEREPIFQWLQAALVTGDNDSIAFPRAVYAKLCALYSIWEIEPAYRGIPLFCNALDQSTLAHAELPEVRRPAPLGLFMERVSLASTFDYTAMAGGMVDNAHPKNRYEQILAAALLDYTAATYGRTQMAALWPVLREHKKWDTLIPAVFGLEVAEFEAGWQAYLTENSSNAPE